MKPPSKLGAAGKALHKAICDDLPEGVEFDARELAVLDAAARQADLIAELETAIKRDGIMVAGAAGQQRMNACVTELRQGRVALARLLSELRVEAEPGGKPRAVPRPGETHAA